MLIVEDNATNLQLMAYLLAAFGHEVLEAPDGAEGIEMARRAQPDLILLDIHMPRMDGYEVARLLKADPECRQIPIIAVTALAMVGDREKILSSGFQQYIAKPINPETFAKEVEALLAAGASLPVRLPATSTIQGDEAIRAPVAARATILYVDNTTHNVELMRSTLEPFGYTLVTADNVLSGIDIAKKTAVDLILSDVHMPHLDGYAFREMLLKDGRLSSIPFAFMTSTTDAGSDRARGHVYGVTKYITRPIEPERLLAEIEACLEKGRGA